MLFLAYSFGLPVVAADVGSLKEEIIEGQTGLVFKATGFIRPGKKTENYFTSELFQILKPPGGDQGLRQ